MVGVLTHEQKQAWRSVSERDGARVDLPGVAH